MAEEDKERPKDDEDEEKEGEEDLSSPEGGFNKKKKIIVIGAVTALLLVGGGAGLYFTGVFGGQEAATEATNEHGAPTRKTAVSNSHGHGAPSEEGDDEDHGNTPVFFSLGDILVNLSGGGKRPNFLKIKVNLELADPKDLEAIEALKPRIIDNFQIYLRELRVEDLRGSAGLYRLREELLLRVTEAAHPVRIRDVLFQEMLVQ